MQHAMFSHPVVVIVPRKPTARPWECTAVDLDEEDLELVEDSDEPIALPIHSFASWKALAAATVVGVLAIALLATLTTRPRHTSSVAAHAAIAVVPARPIPPPDPSVREATVVSPVVTTPAVAAPSVARRCVTARSSIRGPQAIKRGLSCM